MIYSCIGELYGFVSFVVKQHLKTKIVLSVYSSATIEDLDGFVSFVLLQQLKSWMALVSLFFCHI